MAKRERVHFHLRKSRTRPLALRCVKMCDHRINFLSQIDSVGTRVADEIENNGVFGDFHHHTDFTRSATGKDQQHGDQ